MQPASQPPQNSSPKGAFEQVPPVGRPSGISGTVLKWIAIITMLIDHIGAAVVEKAYLHMHRPGSPMKQFFGMGIQEMWNFNLALRLIGRVAFPIFCFLLVEGFVHTKDVKKYALRLGVFALLSELPFDLAFMGSKSFEWSHQNVFVTLLLGLVGCWALAQAGIPSLAVVKGGSAFGNSAAGSIQHSQPASANVPPPPLPFAAGLLGAGAALAAGHFSNSDYGFFGVALILMLYLLRSQKKTQILAGALMVAWEFTAPLAFIPLWFYNGKRGGSGSAFEKWFFYLFYPLHLLLLFFIARQLGVS